MLSTTRGSQMSSARLDAAAEPPSEDHDGSQTEASDLATDQLAIAGPFDDGDTDDGNAILGSTDGNTIPESQLAALGTTLTKALNGAVGPV